MQRARLPHGVAFAAVLTVVSFYAVSGGVGTTPRGSVEAILLSAFVTILASAAVRAVAEFQAWRQKANFVGPLVWSATVAWGVSTYLLLGHPRSLTSGRPVLSSLAFAALLVGPFALYWTIYYWTAHRAVLRRMP
jgi:hypothetical protein